MVELQTLESIIKGKPEGMSYFAQLEAPVNKDIYLDDCMMINEIAIFSKDDNKFIAVDSDSVCIDAIINMRSLADIEKQIDQLKEIERLKVVNLTLIEHILRLSEKYADLKIKSDANQWAHDNMQTRLASIKTICYECDTQVWELSPRSRCVKCEHRRAIFNEKDNDSLREKLECKNQ
jgi:hypothetical protein